MAVAAAFRPAKLPVHPRKPAIAAPTPQLDGPSTRLAWAGAGSSEELEAVPRLVVSLTAPSSPALTGSAIAALHNLLGDQRRSPARKTLFRHL